MTETREKTDLDKSLCVVDALGVGCELYVDVTDWSRLRHYRSRRPVWLKLHIALLRDDRYLSLTAAQRALLHGIWLLFAETRGRVKARPSWLSSNLGFRVTTASLEALVHAGFITVCASGERHPF